MNDSTKAKNIGANINNPSGSIIINSGFDGAEITNSFLRPPVRILPPEVNYFTGREDVLENIRRALEKHRKASLSGTHGLGKSSIAKEFAKRWNKEKDVIFIRASQTELETNISETVKELKLALSDTPTYQEILSTFRDWLATNEDWLLILDNVDEVEQITTCNFPFAKGNVLMTSNNAQIHDIGHKIITPNMPGEDAMLLLYRHKERQPDFEFKNIPSDKIELIRQIAEKFGNPPLAMSFVGAYLATEQESFEEFLEVYEDKEENLLEKYEFLSAYQYREVATAFLRTFEQITTPKDESEREKLIAIAIKDYLKICVYLSPDNIPEELLKACLSLRHPEQVELADDNKIIKEVRKRLNSYSLFERNIENHTLSTHQIVQEVMRFQIKQDEEIPILECVAQVFSEQMPAPDYTNSEIIEKYLNHLQVFLEYLESNKKDKILLIENIYIAYLCNIYARFYELYGQLKPAEVFYEKFKDMCEHIPNIDENSVAVSYNNLGLFYKNQGRYNEAEALYLKCLAITKRQSGDKHPDIACIYNNLAELYIVQKRFNEAEQLHLKSILIREELLGFYHADTAQSYNNLAELYKIQKKYDKAEPLLLKSILIHEKTLGLENPLTATGYDNLAVLYHLQDKYDKAEPLHLKSLLIFENTLGADHFDTATAYNNFGTFYAQQRKFVKAKKYLEMALRVFKSTLGDDHPSTTKTKITLLNVRRAQLKDHKKNLPHYLIRSSQE